MTGDSEVESGGLGLQRSFRPLRRRAKRLKRQIWALYLAMRDPQTPTMARIIIVVAVAYAASPIDLIPDFIPLLGQLDDLLILPGLIVLALRLIPPSVAARCRREAWKQMSSGAKISSPAGKVATAIIVSLWIAVILWILKAFGLFAG